MLLSLDVRKHVVLVLLDLSAEFDTITHEILLTELHRIGVQGDAHHWIESYITDRTQCVSISDHLSCMMRPIHGVPQGSVLGPLLFLVYCAGLSDVFSKHGIRYHVYADDIDFPRNDSAFAIDRIRRCVIDVKAWLASRCLLLNEVKTEAKLFAAPNRMTKPSPLQIDICGSVISTSANICDLGMYLDSTMSMTTHVTRMCSTAYSRLRNITHIRSSLPLLACKTLVHALVTSTLDFGNAALFGITGTLLHRLEMVQRAAALVVLCIDRRDHRSMTAALRELHWLPIAQRIEFKVLTLMHGAVHNSTPPYLSDDRIVYQHMRQRALFVRGPSRWLSFLGSTLNPMAVERSNAAGLTLWNALPLDMRIRQDPARFNVAFSK